MYADKVSKEESTSNMFKEVVFATKVVLGDDSFHTRWGILQVCPNNRRKHNCLKLIELHPKKV